MSGKCEKCGEAPAVVHITEMMDGMVMERDLCEKCAEIRTFTETPPLHWTCHCGRAMEWKFDLADCGHEPANYVMAGEAEREVAVCSCGMHYVARFQVWKCEICGQTSLFPPRLGGGKGFLREYLYGPSHSAKVEIKGVKGGTQP
ncbi:MAG: hypothetical protein JW909_12855 [Planctomycetes bacterium]|nr:hypothetical protein [Planctomycetota bacterium]